MNIFENEHKNFFFWLGGGYACMVFKISQNENNFCGRVIDWNLFLVCVV